MSKRMIMPSKRDEFTALLEAYRINREELQGFRDTIFRAVTILVGVLLALGTAIVEFERPELIPLVPIPIALMVLAIVAYAEWRWELIRVTAAIEEKIIFPKECRYECGFLKHRGLFGGMGSLSFVLAVFLTGIAMVVFYSKVVPSILPASLASLVLVALTIIGIVILAVAMLEERKKPEE